ncbi:MAG TPA: hypothetical protein PLP19_20785 [bacterium]|nr:hypothetical protein [bacterium]HPN45932.1 hypothetical protein [bacterium]
MAKGITAISRLLLTIPIKPVEKVFPMHNEAVLTPAFTFSIPDTWQEEYLTPDILRIYPPDVPAFLTIREITACESDSPICLTSSLDLFSISDTWQGRIKGMLHTCVIGQGKTSAAIPVTFILDQFSPDGKHSYSLLFMGKRKAVIQYMMEFIYIRNSIMC